MKDEKIVWGYCRVLTTGQDFQGQKASIYEYANKQGWQIDRVVQTTVSSRKGEKERGIDVLKDAVREGKVDVIIFSELSRLARSVGQICRLVEFFVKDSGASLHFVKEGLVLEDGKRDVGTKVTFFMFSMLAEIERDLISERTREALAARKAQGVVLGRRRGSRILNGRGDEIREKIDQGVKQYRIAEELDCSPNTLSTWIRENRTAKGKWIIKEDAS